MKSPPLEKQFPIFGNPWLFFILFSISNCLISYTEIALDLKLWVTIFGLVLPFASAWLCMFKTGQPALDWQNGPKFSWWAWGFPVLLGIVLRFKDLSTLSAWPIPDEGYGLFFAMEEIQDAKWQFFYGFSECPPLYPWISGFFYTWIPISLFSLWLLPALLSTASFIVGIWTARRWLPSFPAWIFSLFLAFNFWALYNGRFYNHFVAVLLLEFTAWFLLAVLLQTRSAGIYRFSSLLLGSCIGLGFWLAQSWPVIGLPPLLVFLNHWWIHHKKNYRELLLPTVPILLCLAFFGYFAARQGYGNHFWSSFVMGRGSNGLLQWANSASYLTVPFWGHRSVGYYGPAWGGLLGAFTGALIFLGWVSILKKRTPWNAPFYFFVLGLGVLPGILTVDCEMFRTIQWIPFLIAAAVVGTMELINGIKKSLKIPLLVLLIAASGFLEVYHLFGPYHEIWGKPNAQWINLKSIEFYKAYGILKKQAEKEGPGALLFDLLPAVTDQTLVMACHPFDSVHNPRIPFSSVRWVAIMAHEDYQPFLNRRFPESRWFRLAEGLPYVTRGGVLGIIRFQSQNQDELRRFIEADRILKPSVSQAMHLAQNRSHGEILQNLFMVYPYFQKDPFLESCFWEKMIYYSQKDQQDQDTFNAIEESLEHGYPLAHLLAKRSTYLNRLGSK